MDEKMINYILMNHQLDAFEIRKQKESVEMENEKYLVSVIIYHQALAEEMIYDKTTQETTFYFHHECLDYYQSISYMDDFFRIASELTKIH